MWGRFFQKAEIEKMVDQDLSRLYPEHGSYFQTPGCQGVLRRILLLWCIRHPNYGYRQGNILIYCFIMLKFILHFKFNNINLKMSKLVFHYFKSLCCFVNNATKRQKHTKFLFQGLVLCVYVFFFKPINKKKPLPFLPFT